MSLSKYNCIILDCDGVIFDSNYLKIDAFSETFKELGFNQEVVNVFRKYMKKNFGISRYEFAKYFIKNILNKDLDKALYENIIKIYSKKVYELYLKASFTLNLLEFLEENKNKALYIASGSDEQELRDVFIKRDLDKYFIEVFGSPKKKSDIVKEIIQKEKNAVMIGDAKSDMMAAKNNSIDFIFVSQYSTDEDIKKNSNIKSIENLGDLIE